jgi:hypothetical protein
MLRPMWRPEDAALLARLEEELLLRRLWRSQAGSADPPHPRAAGMLGLARRLPGGAEAVTAALKGDLAALLALLQPARFEGYPPALLHHVALYFDSVAGAIATSAPEAAVEARVRSMAAWLALGEEKSYLRALAGAVVTSASRDLDLDQAAAEAPLALLSDLGLEARAGARDRTLGARSALRTLGRVAEAGAIAGCAPAVIKAIVRRAESLRTTAVDEALSPLLEAITEASMRGDLAESGPELLARVAAVWRWADEDEAVEHFAVEQTTPIAWEVYRESRWPELRRLLDPIEPLIDRLARRIESDPTKIAYAAACAQMFVFRSEAHQSVDRQLELAERGVKLCPTHRNGRLILAYLLCDRAKRMIDGPVWVSAGDCDRAAALIQRAETLYPDSKALPPAREKLDEVRRRVKR